MFRLSMASSGADTPLMRQYNEIKSQHQDAILLFRLGDFYEMFFEDAKVASKILDIALTSRDKKSKNPVPLCGVPHHAVTGYISKLLNEGCKVALCEQIEDPKDAKGIVKREVVRVISPGMQTDAEGLEATETNSLVALFAKKDEFGLAWIDVAGGSFYIATFKDLIAAEAELWKLSPREVIVPEGLEGKAFERWIQLYSVTHSGLRVERLADWVYEKAPQKLAERFQVGTLHGFGLENKGVGVAAAWGLLHYTEGVNRSPLPHLYPPVAHEVDRFLQLDPATESSLEIFRNQNLSESNHTLFDALNETETAMGARQLKVWLRFPLRDVQGISERLDVVEELLEGVSLRESLQKEFEHVYDLERLIGRVAGARANARDLVALRSTLWRADRIHTLLTSAKAKKLQDLRQDIIPDASLLNRLEKALLDDPPFSTREGRMIREGFSPELDSLRQGAQGNKGWIAELERKERERTGISSLKVSYNRVFGYYIEITKSNLSKVPENYHRKQTLVNAERFVTPELKERENWILSAEEKIYALEHELFEKLRSEVSHQMREIQALGKAMADLDVFCSLARVAGRSKYCRPTLHDGDELSIQGGRHPVVEKYAQDEPFVPNDVTLDRQSQQLIILTGPNMAGKSTIVRQLGLICLMAQIGSFVPADEARIGLVDRIYTRVGASDDLVGGRSTFMVEMSETANILRSATDRSLVLLDEIGRGTSTFDGLSLAWAVAEDLHDRVQARTIFATHYHEITDLARTKSRVKNMNVMVKEWDGKIVFLHTLAQGAVNRSYGIEVAKLAGIPFSVVERAREILKNLEKSELDATGAPVLAMEAQKAPKKDQLELFRRMGDDMLEELNRTDLDCLSPREALDLLYEWRNRFRKKT